jgi:ferredoxin
VGPDAVFADATAAVDALIHVLAEEGRTVVGPTVRDGAIGLHEVRAVTDLPIGWGDAQEAGTYRLRRRDDDAMFGYAVGPQSPRSWLSPPRQTLLTITRRGDELELREPAEAVPRYAFLGVRACELAAIAVQDRVLLDERYVQARAAAVFIGVSCSDPAATCFCTSMGTGPAVTSGHDLVLTELLGGGRHELAVSVGSEVGAEILTAVQATVAGRDGDASDAGAVDAVTARCAAGMTRHLDPIEARDVLAASLDHPRWDDVAERCLSCASCTLVCPTCFCATVEDVTDLSGDEAQRVQRWDSCFTLDHSYLHGGGSVRGDTRARYRQWLTHKLSTWWDQFDVSGCVGCGRCIAWCPVAIDITEEVAAMAPDRTDER